MADELSVSIYGKLENGDLERLFNPDTISVDQAAKGARWVVVNVGTSEEDIVTTEIGTLGWCFLRNLDSTNYVQYGPKDTTMKVFGRIEAGEVAGFRLEPGITIRAKANTAAVELDVLILED